MLKVYMDRSILYVLNENVMNIDLSLGKLLEKLGSLIEFILSACNICMCCTVFS